MEEKDTRTQAAAERKRSGKYNCCQSVVCTFCDKTGLDEATAMNVAGAFGSGMGNREGTCGALVGAGIVLGLVVKDTALSRSRMGAIMEKFQERNGATRCGLLKGKGTGKVLRECTGCVTDAVELLEACL